MAEILETDICVIGAGSGGLTMAAGASQMGARTVLVEKAEMGGDCLNTGCVPSKALLAAAHTAATMRESSRFGINGAEPKVDFHKVHDHVHQVIAGIAPNDSEERFEGLGVTVIRGTAQFTGRREIEAAGRRVRAKWFVIATGSSAAVPPIPGLDQVPFLTNETIFTRTAAPEHLIIIGGGPIGCEMAQAYRRLGARVTVLELFTIFANDDPEAVDIVRRRLADEGVDILEGVQVVRVAKDGNGIAVTIEEDGKTREIKGSDLLVATGRRASVDGLNLEAAGIAHDAKGIEVDSRLRTSNKRVFAIGDVVGRFQFTHVASYHAGIVIRNILFRLPARVNESAVPWVTYTDPELAHVGQSEAAARAAGTDIRVLRWPFAENDRARAERALDGFVKVITSPRGKVLGATIVGAKAGELLLPWVLAVGQGLKIGVLAGTIAPYPTLSEASKRAAGTFFAPKLFGAGVKRLVRFLLRFA